jgi:hypothetical protein
LTKRESGVKMKQTLLTFRGKEAKTVGYDLHITRAEDWTESEASPISREEWRAVVEADASLSEPEEEAENRELSGDPDYEPAVQWHEHPELPLFWYGEGRIHCKNPDERTVLKAVELARKLNARVQGDDGELYDET